MYFYLCVLCVCLCTCGVQKRVLDPLELELETVVRGWMWVLGTE